MIDGIELTCIDNGMPLVMMRADMDGLPGFTFADCDRLTGDEVDRVVTWRGRHDIADIGETVAVRIRMFQAKMFAYRV